MSSASGLPRHALVVVRYGSVYEAGVCAATGCRVDTDGSTTCDGFACPRCGSSGSTTPEVTGPPDDPRYRCDACDHAWRG